MPLSEDELETLRLAEWNMPGTTVLIAWRNAGDGAIEIGPVRVGCPAWYPRADGGGESAVYASAMSDSWSVVPVSRIERVRLIPNALVSEE